MSFKEALKMELSQIDEYDPAQRKKLRIIADKLVSMAIEGDLAAIKEVMDRIDGKVSATVQINETKQYTEIRRIIVDVPDDGKTINHEPEQERSNPARIENKKTIDINNIFAAAKQQASMDKEE